MVSSVMDSQQRSILQGNEAFIHWLSLHKPTSLRVHSINATPCPREEILTEVIGEWWGDEERSVDISFSFLFTLDGLRIMLTGATVNLGVLEPCVSSSPSSLSSSLSKPQIPSNTTDVTNITKDKEEGEENKEEHKSIKAFVKVVDVEGSYDKITTESIISTLEETLGNHVVDNSALSIGRSGYFLFVNLSNKDELEKLIKSTLEIKGVCKLKVSGERTFKHTYPPNKRTWRH